MHIDKMRNRKYILLEGIPINVSLIRYERWMLVQGINIAVAFAAYLHNINCTLLEA